MDPDGSQWILMDQHGSHRILMNPMDSDESGGIPMALFGFLWNPMNPLDPNGSNRILMDPYGSL